MGSSSIVMGGTKKVIISALSKDAPMFIVGAMRRNTSLNSILFPMLAALPTVLLPWPSYKPRTTAGTVFNFFTGLGDVAFAYARHNVALEIQASFPFTPKEPSKCPMWKGVVVAYIVVAVCYFHVAFIGFWIFGNGVSNNILISLEKPKWLIAMANMFIIFHVIGSYQIYALPVFDMIETLLVKKLHFRPTASLHFITRNIYMLHLQRLSPFVSHSLVVFLDFLEDSPSHLPHIFYLM